MTILGNNITIMRYYYDCTIGKCISIGLVYGTSTMGTVGVKQRNRRNANLQNFGEVLIQTTEHSRYNIAYDHFGVFTINTSFLIVFIYCVKCQV